MSGMARMHKMVEQWVNGEAVEAPTQGEVLGIAMSMAEFQTSGELEASNEEKDQLLEAIGRLITVDVPGMSGREGSR